MTVEVVPSVQSTSASTSMTPSAMQTGPLIGGVPRGRLGFGSRERTTIGMCRSLACDGDDAKAAE